MHVFDPSIFHDPNISLLPLGVLGSQGDFKITVVEFPAMKEFGYKLSEEQYSLIKNLYQFGDTNKLSTEEKGFLLSAARDHLIHVVNEQNGFAELDVIPILRSNFEIQDEKAEKTLLRANGVTFSLSDFGLFLFSDWINSREQTLSLEQAMQNALSFLSTHPEEAAEVRNQNPHLLSSPLEKILLEETVTMVKTLLSVGVISLEYLKSE